jgi:tetratricopeptide (TPR) repeat protein
MRDKKMMTRLRARLREISVGIVPASLCERTGEVRNALHLVATGEYKKAQRLLLTCGEPDGKWPGYTLWEVAHLLVEDCLYEEALRLIPEDTEYPALLSLRANLHYLTGVDTEKVEEACRSNLRKYDQFQGNQALNQKQLRGLDECRAVDKELLGIIKMTKGDIDGAISEYSEAYSLVRLPEAAFNILCAAARKGDFASARVWLERLVADHGLNCRAEMARLHCKCIADAALEPLRTNCSWFYDLLQVPGGGKQIRGKRSD